MSGLMFPDDREPQGTHDGLCIDCDNKANCRSVRWNQRPCEIAKIELAAAQKADQTSRVETALLDTVPATNEKGPAAAPQAPWQIPRDPVALPGLPDPASLLGHRKPVTKTPCTCPPGERPEPCQHRHALSECLAAAQSPVQSGVTVGSTQVPGDVHYVGQSGAKSSGQRLRFDLIPWHIFAARLAKRYGDGAVKYGEVNWQIGLTDRDYILDRANHLLDHVHRTVEKLRLGMQVSADTLKINHEIGMTMPDYDDDEAAALWGLIFIMAAQRGGTHL